MRKSGTCLLLSSLFLGFISSVTIFAQATPPTVAYSYAGPSPVSNLGRSINAAGDVNGDTRADFVVGSPGGSDMFLGSAMGIVDVMSGFDGSVIHSFGPFPASESFGSSSSGAGDVNFDSLADIIIGSPAASPNGITSSGMVRVYSGANGQLLYTFTGAAFGDRLGSAVSQVGDINFDGYADILIGASSESTNGFSSGAVYVYSGFDGSLIHTFLGTTAGARFGHAVSGVGDIDLDGANDILVGAFGATVNGVISGTATVFSGATGSILLSFSGAALGDEFGIDVSGAGDVNCDGYPDILVGARSDATGGVRAGSVQVFSGFDGSVLYRFDGIAEARLGNSVSGAGFVNDDAFADFVLGAPGLDTGNGVGRAYVISGFDGSTIYTADGNGALPFAGTVVAGVGDLNGDGAHDVMLAGGVNPVSFAFSGSARAFFSPKITAVQRYDSILGNTNLKLQWAPDVSDITSTTGTITCSGASSFSFGLFALSYAPIDFPTAFGFPLLVAIDPANLISTGNLGFDLEGRVSIPNATRQAPAIAGTTIFIQLFETFPTIQGSNGLAMLLTL